MDDSGKAREEGKRARSAGMLSRDNPYQRNTVLWLAWVEGYIWQKVHYTRVVKVSYKRVIT